MHRDNVDHSVRLVPVLLGDLHHINDFRYLLEEDLELECVRNWRRFHVKFYQTRSPEKS